MIRSLYSWLAALCVGVLGALSPSSAEACDTITMCIDWVHVSMEDEMFGDVATSNVTPARDARANIIRPYPEPALGVFLDDDGCVEFDSQFRAGHKVVLFPEVVLDWDTPDYIQIRGFESVVDFENGAQDVIEVDIVGIPEDFSVAGTAPTFGLHVPHVVVAAQGLATLQARPGSPLSGAHELNIVLAANQQNGSNPGAEEVRLGTLGFDGLGDSNRSAALKKYIVMHEVGHWLQRQFGISFPPFNYQYGPCVQDGDGEFPSACELNATPYDPVASGNPYNEACTFAIVGNDDDSFTNPNTHGLRSAEFAGGAAVEGFAHFIAAAAFNTAMGSDADGVFRYYKNADESILPSYEDFEDNNRVVSLSGGAAAATLGGENAWVENLCPDDWDHPYTFGGLASEMEISTELDWLRFFWRFVTAPDAGTRPTFWETVEYVNFVQSLSGANALEARRVWTSYEAGVLDSSSPAFGFASRFYDLSDEQGLINVGP